MSADQRPGGQYEPGSAAARLENWRRLVSRKSLRLNEELHNVQTIDGSPLRGVRLMDRGVGWRSTIFIGRDGLFYLEPRFNPGFAVEISSAEAALKGLTPELAEQAWRLARERADARRAAEVAPM